MDKTYTKSEKLEYFKKLLEEADKRLNVLYARQIIAENRIEFLKKKIQELEQ